MGTESPEGIQEPDDRGACDAIWKDIFKLLRELPGLSEADWTEDRKALWNQLVDLRMNSRLDEFKARGHSQKEAQKLVRRGWAFFDPETGDLVVERAPPEGSTPCAPVVTFFGDGVFEIDDMFPRYLYNHPALSYVPRETSGGDARESVLLALEEVDTLVKELGLGQLSLQHLLDVMSSSAVKDKRAVICGRAAYRLRCLLDPEFLGGDLAEDLEWLRVGSKGGRLWQLIKAAVFFGEVRERRRVFDELHLDEAGRRVVTAPPGKNTGEEGRAFEKMVETCAAEIGHLPTPTELLEWLGAKPPHETDKPLVVSHSLWAGVRTRPTWAQFQQLVKDAKRRIRRRPN